jgi:hypothetical protein
MDPVKFLSQFTLEGSESWKSRPLSLKAGRFFWSVASSGYMLVSLRHPLVKSFADAPFEKLVQEGNPIPIEKLTQYLVTPPGPGFEIKVEDLRSWAGDPPLEMVPSKKVQENRVGILLGRVIDLRKLAWFLHNLNGVDKLYVWDSSEVFGVWSLSFEWDDGGGRAVIAGVNWEPDPNDPVFKLEENPFDWMLSLSEN